MNSAATSGPEPYAQRLPLPEASGANQTTWPPWYRPIVARSRHERLRAGASRPHNRKIRKTRSPEARGNE